MRAPPGAQVCTSARRDRIVVGMIPAGVSRVVFSGTIAEEQWSSGFWLNQQQLSTAGATAAATAIRTIAVAQQTSLTLFWCSHVALTDIRVYDYGDSSGHASDVGEAPVTSYVGGSTAHGPYQLCQVLTLHTALAGRRRRGRMYWPAPGGVFATHLFNASNAQQVCTGMGSLFNAINTSTSVAGSVSVLSQRDGNAVVVEDVATDLRADIQRRRADSQLVGAKFTFDVTP